MRKLLLSHEDFAKREKEKARRLRKTRWWMRKLTDGVCYYCGLKFPATELTMDHLIPLSKGGMSARENIVAACRNCNTKKNSQLTVDWTEYMERLKGMESLV
ncbi:HNH endonuclease [Candidatus Magnetomonas plexicatena]|uniref:HNH endonuclease n=1 Tax=Candidatus Magnetomonas plexicatena TaxID=2552947 RepID=UPI004032A64B